MLTDNDESPVRESGRDDGVGDESPVHESAKDDGVNFDGDDQEEEGEWDECIKQAILPASGRLNENIHKNEVFDYEVLCFCINNGQIATREVQRPFLFFVFFVFAHTLVRANRYVHESRGLCTTAK